MPGPRIKISERLPREDETLKGRVPIIDKDGYLGYAMLVDNGVQAPWLMCEMGVGYWLAVPSIDTEQWIKISERLPREDETHNGRVPIVDSAGYLGYAMLIDNGTQKPWLMSEMDVAYWLPVPLLTLNSDT